MRKSFRQILLAALVLTFICGTAFANTSVNISIDITGENGRGILWDQGVVEAGGMGVVPPNAVNPAQGKAMARRAAIVDAQRNLLEATKGVQVNSETTVRESITTSDVIRTRVEGLVKGARIVVEQDRVATEGTYVVIMQMSMYGSGNLAETVVFGTIKPAQIQPFPQPAPSYRPAAESYTGLVIVAKNKGLQGSFSPRVYDESGTIIYGDKYIKPDFAISEGMVSYTSLDVARSGNSRAGSRPLIIDATELRDHNFNVVISNADAQKVLAAQAQSGFMRECKVVFVKS